MTGNPIAAQMPAMSIRLLVLGNKNYAMQEKSGIIKPMT